MRGTTFETLVLVVTGWAAVGCGGGSGGGGGGGGSGTTSAIALVGSNDLGMHCVDRDFSVFSILPPYNVVHVQVARQLAGGHARLLDAADVDVTYQAVADPSGSINSTSVIKTNFWAHAADLFGVNLAPGVGLSGASMPADAAQPGPQPMSYDAAHEWFTAQGVPILPRDDAGHPNHYPLLRVVARDHAGGAELAHIDVVVPVSDETDCSNCHSTGGIAASKFGVTWSNDPNLEVQTRQNVLLLHDFQDGTSLATSTPVLCAECHYSAALDLAGSGPSSSQVGHASMSAAMHAYHGALTVGGQAVFPDNGSMLDTCYQCHPGAVTQCARGPMVAAGMECLSCHGTMAAVGGAHDLLSGGSLDGSNDGQPRRPWVDLPRCQACHTGDAVSHLSGPDLVAAPDGIRLEQAWRVGDPSASPLLAVNQRFAENPGTLFRFSKGHGGVSCEGCHGSTHAEWPNADPTANDNLASKHLQGHAGVLIECSACHATASLPITTQGPHGLHNIGDPRFVDEVHGDLYHSNPASCRACHGTNLEGTVLARVATTRTFAIEDGHTKALPAGTLVSCSLCHSKP